MSVFGQSTAMLTNTMGIDFPDGKYNWRKGVMTHSGWNCDFSAQKSGELWSKMHPFDIHCSVFVTDGGWRWRVAVTGWEGGRTDINGAAESPEQAVEAAERVAEQHWQALMPEWGRDALRHGWRPPATSVQVQGCIPPVTVVNFG